MLHVDVDLHKQASQIAVLTAEGTLTAGSTCRTPLGRIGRYFEELPGPVRVAIEASGVWRWPVDLLYRMDAGRLVLLRGDLLPTAWIPWPICGK